MLYDNRQFRIIFFSGSFFGKATLEKLTESDMTPILCVTKPDAIVGRKKQLQENIIGETSKLLNIATIKPPTLRDIKAQEQIRLLKPDVGILVSYGKIIPAELISLFPFGIINIHPSLLPRYRGPSPIQTAILNGDPETGVSIMLLDNEVDHGPVLAQIKCPIGSEDRYSDLARKLSDLGSELLTKVLPLYITKDIKPIEQNHENASFTHKIGSEDGRINEDNPLTHSWNQFRALGEEPGCFIMPNNFYQDRYKIIECKPSKLIQSDLKGQIFSHEDNLYFGLLDGSLQIDIIQKAGGVILKAREFLNGNKTKVPPYRTP